MQHVRIRNLFVSLKTIPEWNGFRWHYLVFRCIIIMYPCAKASERHLLYTHTRACIYISFVVVSYQCLEWMTQRPRSECLCFLCLSFLYTGYLTAPALGSVSATVSSKSPCVYHKDPCLPTVSLGYQTRLQKTQKKPSPKHIFRHFEFLKNIMYYLFAQSNPSTYIPISMAWAQLHAMQSWKHALK